MDFKDFLSVNYTPGMPGQISKNAKKRKQDIPTGNTGESVQRETKECGCGPDCPCEGNCGPDCNCGPEGCGDNTNEALNMQQRRAKARQMKRYKSRIKLGQDRAKRKMASPEVIKKRARKAARKAVFMKLTKDMPKDELTYQRRQSIEKRLDSPAMKRKIDQLSRKMIPAVRKKETARKRAK